MTADLMLYRRMRGMFWGMLVTGVVLFPFLLAFVLAVPPRFELYPSGTIADIGGAEGVLGSGTLMLGATMSLAALLLGATAGSVDFQRGVIRDLVLAGRPRWRIVVGRLAGAFVWLALAVTVASTLIVAMASLAPGFDDLDWEEFARNGASFLPTALVTLAFAAGVAMLLGSRGPTIAVYFVFTLVIGNVIGLIPKVGAWWNEISFGSALSQVSEWVSEGSRAAEPYDRSNGAALATLVGWGVIPFVVGVVRLSRRDL